MVKLIGNASDASNGEVSNAKLVVQQKQVLEPFVGETYNIVL